MDKVYDGTGINFLVAKKAFISTKEITKHKDGQLVPENDKGLRIWYTILHTF